MLNAPFFTIGFITFIAGLLSLPLQQKPGLDWVPWAQMGIGLLLILIKLVWAIKHKDEINEKAKTDLRG